MKLNAKELGYKLGHLFNTPQDIMSASEILYEGDSISQAEFFLEGAKAWEVYYAIQEETSKGIQDLIDGFKYHG
tara:strand:+ start:576 stop:797 length:222 start_codon:yes stop_codon:yes gene_type:complete